MVFTTEGFLEVAIEIWPEWDLNPRPLNSVQTLYSNFIHPCLHPETRLEISTQICL